SWVRNEITHFNTGEVSTISNYFNIPPPTIGRSRDVVYAQPWHGLDADTGMPIVYIEGARSSDYLAYYQSLTPGDLLVAGVSVPTGYGSFRNDFSWKGFSVSALVSWKSSYVFRRSSMRPGREYYADYH